MTVAQLDAALKAAAPGSTVRTSLVTGKVTATLLVPDHVTLEGSGAMTFDAHGRPVAIAGVPTTLAADPAFGGDVIALGRGAVLRTVVVRGNAGSGNLVMVTSGKPHDEVSAVIDQCELFNHAASGPGADGPRGRGLVVLTRNDNKGSAPPPDDGARIDVRMQHCIVHSPGGGSGVFVANFAPQAHVELHLDGNVIGGGLDATGGVSRPDPVIGADTKIVSTGNLYRSEGAGGGRGWSLHAGSNPPIPTLAVPAGTNFNTLEIESTGDVLEGFDVAVYAAAGARPLPTAGPVTGNIATLSLTGTVFERSAVADLMLFGAEAGGAFAPGDDNRLSANFVGVRPSAKGAAGDVFKDAAVTGGGALPAGMEGVGNFVQITGDLLAKPVIILPSGKP